MNLVVLYGPPAVGKYTVAKELSKLTGYKLFHNHLTVDMVLPVFGRDTKIYDKLVERYRVDMIREAAKNDVNIIFTMIYAYKMDDKILKNYIKIVNRNGGKVYFVRLYTKVRVLQKRVKGKSRLKFKKVKDQEGLKSILSEFDTFKDVPFKPNISIDNTNLEPKSVAKLIVKRYHF
jgi:predicted kinase